MKYSGDDYAELASLHKELILCKTKLLTGDVALVKKLRLVKSEIASVHRRVSGSNAGVSSDVGSGIEVSE